MSPPEPLDPLIGRTDELSSLDSALAEARLVTVTGLGGTGKTRLAREIARRALAAGGRVRFVDLAPVVDRDGLATAIGAAIGVRDSAEVDLSTAIADELARSPSLLVLDNFEHLLSARAFVGSLIERAAPLRILLTSRVRLGLPGEFEFPLGPLRLPGTPQELDESEAGRLFLRRARERGRLQAMHEEDAAAIAAICWRLDGLPLALELAAAWTRILSPAAIARRLEDGRLELTGAEDARQASLAAVVETTLGLVGRADAAAFETLGVFSGGFDEPAAAAVTGIADVLPVIRRLEEVALVRVVGGSADEPRFGLLETIRAVATKRLLARDDDEAIRQRHLEHFTREASRGLERLPDFGSADTFSMRDFISLETAAWLLTEEGNLRVAHARALACDDGPSAVVLAGSMATAALRSGALREAAARVTRALEMSDVPPAVRAQALVALAWLRYSLWDHPSLRTIATDALELAGSTAPSGLIVRALTVSHLPQPHDIAALEKAADLAKRMGSGWAVAACQMNLGDVLAREGRIDEALHQHAEAFRAFSDNGDEVAASFALSNVGEMHANLGSLDEAIGCQRRAVAGLRATGQAVFVAWALDVLAAAEALDGQPAAAYDHLAEASDLVAASESTEAIVEFLDAATTVLADEHPRRAAQALGAVDRQVERSGERRPGGRLLAKAAADIERALGPVRFGLERQAGRDGDPRSVFQEIRAVLSERASASGASASATTSPVRAKLKGPFGSFTDREAEVLALLAEGRSDGEIASELFISPKTASVHVANIKGKLGVATRLQAALVARQLIDPSRDRKPSRSS